MKNKLKYLIIVIGFFTVSCVQKSYKQTVVLELEVSGFKNVKTVGVRGQDKPLNWNEDLPMKEIIKDSLYTVTIVGETGYLFTELKFVVNGQFEFENQENRKLVFDESGKTKYFAKFNLKK